MLTTSGGEGYWIVTADGELSPYGDAPHDGAISGVRLNGSIIAATGWWILVCDTNAEGLNLLLTCLSMPVKDTVRRLRLGIVATTTTTDRRRNRALHRVRREPRG